MKHCLAVALLLLAASALCAQQEYEKIRLMIRGDDFGYSHAANLAMAEAFEKGVMSSGSLLVPAPWFSEAAAILRKHPEWSVGVHLTITSEWNRLRWRPVSPISAVPSLVAPDGYLWGYGYSRPKPADWPADGAPWAEHAPDPAEVEREFRAQIERARASGVRIDYVDCHMGMGCREELLPITQKLAAEYCLGISGGAMFGEKRARGQGDGAKPASVTEGFLAMLESLTPGLWLYVEHPAVDSSELRAVDSNRGVEVSLARNAVLEMMIDPRVRETIQRRGIEVVSMRDLFDHEACRPR